MEKQSAQHCSSLRCYAFTLRVENATKQLTVVWPNLYCLDDSVSLIPENNQRINFLFNNFAASAPGAETKPPKPMTTEGLTFNKIFTA